jgi:hypothetical protein
MNSETSLFLSLNMCADKTLEEVLGTHFSNNHTRDNSSSQVCKRYNTFSPQEQRKCPPPPPPKEEKKLHINVEESSNSSYSSITTNPIFVSEESKDLRPPFLRERSKTNLEVVTTLFLSDTTKQVIHCDFNTKLLQPILGKNTPIQGYSNICLVRDKNSNMFKFVKNEETTRRLSLVRPSLHYSDLNIICCTGDVPYKKYLTQKYGLLCGDNEWFQCDTRVILSIVTEMLEKRIQAEASIKRKLDNVMD